MEYGAGQVFIEGGIFFTKIHKEEKEQANHAPINPRGCFITTALFLSFFSSITITVISSIAIFLIFLLHLWQLNYNFTSN